MFVRTISLLVILCWFVLRSQAQSPNARFTFLTTNQGLSQNNVTCILRDRKGFMWFGTRDGLNKFDGYTFTVYRNDPVKPTSLSNSYVHALVEDKQGRLWIGTDNGGLSLFDPVSETFINYTHTPGRPSSLAHNKVVAIAQDTSGNLWVGTGGGGLDRFDIRQKIFTHFVHQPGQTGSLSHNEVSSVLIDRRGIVWVGTLGGGLNRLDPSTSTFTHFVHNPQNAHSLSQNRVTACLEDSRGRFWVATEGGLNLLDRQQGVFTHYLQETHQLSLNDVKALAEDNNHTIWIGTQNGGINLLHADGTFSYYAYQVDSNWGLNSGSIYSLYRDPLGTMWIGTFSGGVNKLDTNPLKFNLYQRSLGNTHKLTNNNILTVLLDQRGDLWLGTDGGGINRLRKGQSVFKAYQDTGPLAASNSANFVLTMYEDRQKRIWTGHYKGGLRLYNPVRDSFEPKGNFSPLSISTILEARSGMMWLGTYEEGLIRYDPATGSVVRYQSHPTQAGQLTYHTITSLWEDRLGNIWVGTDGSGINVFHPDRNQFTQFKQESHRVTTLSNNQVNCLFESTTGQLWIGTNSGLNRYDARTQTFTAYGQNQGLPNAVIQAILEDGRGRLWLSTNNGLSRFDPRTGYFRHYDARDGLQDSPFNQKACYKSLKGALFFGGQRGLNWFHPDSIQDNPVIPPVYLTDFQLFNRSVQVGDSLSVLTRPIGDTRQITLSYQQSVLSFQFTALNYTLSEKNQYAYKLDGFDHHWIQAGTQRTATYTNLDPGDYVFRVIASNNDGVWNRRGTYVHLHIRPPFWKTGWFTGLVSLLLAGSLSWLYRFRMKRIHATQIALQDQLIQQSLQATQQNETQRILQQSLNREKELNQLKSQFVSTVSHEFRTPLTGISTSVELIQHYLRHVPDNLVPPAIGRHLQAIIRKVQSLDELIGDTLTISKLEAGKVEVHWEDTDLVAFCEAMMEVTLGERADGRRVDLNVEGTPVRIKVDKKLLGHILLNLLGNAFKFSTRNPSLRISFEEHQVALLVRDEGIGIPADQLDQLFGKFFRARNATAYQGTGLGLVICQDYTYLMGGRLEVVSEEGMGSSFTLTLPKSVPDQEPKGDWQARNSVE
ncbi:sensor histidine kinase [Spirosoma linguale]|uniref:histidine kinase n=1 Tax=Spirosoma linguale (strain ATCC 33905 / DSM 74 / LMG 10896 / Claus 1) TaxID=504472 RepID=D2QI85_SPILD|nr:histidine kinase [Spirosoma linguale DSM 74]